MRKTLCALVLGAACLLIFSACSNDDSSSGNHMGSEHMGGQLDEATPTVSGAREIEMDATSFEFDPKTLRVAAGEPFTIVLTSDNVEHDFDIEGQDGHVSAKSGETKRGGFQIDQPGTYTYRCTVSGHQEAGMEGTIVID